MVSSTPLIAEPTPAVPLSKQHLLKDLLPIHSGLRRHGGIRGSELLFPGRVVLLGRGATSLVGLLRLLIALLL